MFLKELFTFSNGKASQSDGKASFPIYGSTGIVGNTYNPIFSGKNTLIARVGANCGFLQLVDGSYNVTDNTIIATANNSILPEYGHYLLGTLDLQRLRIGSGQPLLTIGILNSIETSVHSLDDQRHIVDTIGTIDDLIEKYGCINKSIDKYYDLIFRTEDNPNTTLDNYCMIKYGKAFEASKLTQNYDYPVYGGNGIIGSLETYMFPDSKVSISCRGAASGNVYFTKPCSSISSNSLYLDKLSCEKSLALYYYLKHSDLHCYCTGSAQPQITIDNLKTLKIPSSLFDIKCETNLMKTYFINLEKAEKLKKIKSVLLAKYF